MKNSIQHFYDKACELAVQEVEKEARKILREHKHLDYFIMAMGTYYFVDKKGQNIDTQQPCKRNGHNSWDHSFKYFEKLTNLICEWDEYLKITGNAMKFTADGKVITDW